VIVALLALSAGVAQAHRASSADTPAMVVSPNWSGYVATSPTTTPIAFSSVTGTWVVPTATCASRDAGSFSTVWVGLGGYTTKNQEEVGTDTNCDSQSRPSYYAWFELVPYIAYKVPAADKVLAGDTMTGLVKILSTSLVELQIQDQTSGWTFSRNITFSSQDTSTAEWISEAPATCLRFACHEANLANFGSVDMTGISATGDGKTGTLTDPDWNVIPIQLVPSQMLVPTLNPEALSNQRGHANSPAGATPGPFSPDGTSFTQTWVPVAHRGL
jgi:hypothetical protein